MRDELRRKLHAIDERLADVPVPAALERRVMVSIAEPSLGPSRVLVGAAVLVAVVLSFVLGLRLRDEPAPAPTSAPSDPATVATAPVEAPAIPRATATPQQAWDGALALDPDCRVSTVDDSLQLEAGCRMTLDRPALAMQTWSQTRIGRTDHGVRVHSGNLVFAVEHVPDGEPRVRVDVDAGAIEVIGTRFAVVQDGTIGHVDLLEGVIAFVDREGLEHTVRPGRRLSWTDGRVVATKVPAEASDPRRDTGAPAGLDHDAKLDATLETVAALRRAGRYRDAVQVLHRARRSLGDGEGAEILSFEEGTLREHDTAAPAMCAFWRGHLARFPGGDYHSAVRTRLKRMGCEDR
jgi:hypothetical protein